MVHIMFRLDSRVASNGGQNGENPRLQTQFLEIEMREFFLDCLPLGAVVRVCARGAEVGDVNEAVEHLHL